MLGMIMMMMMSRPWKGRAWDGHVVSVRSISRKPTDGGQMLFSAELT